MATIHEVSSGLPHPDEAQRVQNIVRELNSARLEMYEAHARLTAFVAEGIVPDNLKNDAVREERSGQTKKKGSSQ